MEANYYEFALAEIKTDQFALFEEHLKPQKKHEVSLKTDLQIGAIHEERQLFIGLEFVFNQGKNVLMKIGVTCSFDVSDETWQGFMNDEQQLLFPKAFVEHLTVICIGTTRGVLHAKTEGTVFQTYFLPTINVRQLIEDDVLFG